MRFHLPSFWEVKSRSDRICPVEPGRHSVVKAGRESPSELKLPLLAGGVVQCFVQDSYRFSISNSRQNQSFRLLCGLFIFNTKLSFTILNPLPTRFYIKDCQASTWKTNLCPLWLLCPTQRVGAHATNFFA